MTKDDLIGKTESEATHMLQEAMKWEQTMRFRIVSRDEEAFVYTMELRPNRFNLVINEGFVTNVWMG